jgi:hypothetical protein
MKSITLCDAFDRQDISAIVTDRKRQARIDPSSVENDSTRTALPAVAALFGSSQFQAFAQKIEKRDPRIIERDRSLDAVHCESR